MRYFSSGLHSWASARWLFVQATSDLIRENRSKASRVWHKSKQNRPRKPIFFTLTLSPLPLAQLPCQRPIQKTRSSDPEPHSAQPQASSSTDKNSVFHGGQAPAECHHPAGPFPPSAFCLLHFGLCCSASGSNRNRGHATPGPSPGGAPDNSPGQRPGYAVHQKSLSLSSSNEESPTPPSPIGWERGWG